MHVVAMLPPQRTSASPVVSETTLLDLRFLGHRTEIPIHCASDQPKAHIAETILYADKSVHLVWVGMLAGRHVTSTLRNVKKQSQVHHYKGILPCKEAFVHLLPASKGFVDSAGLGESVR